ncbi:MAG: hypothetical protein ED555_09855 [Allomuricauda sp.]|nr:MAG: hypothetical protein ED555_09855 [Allomuricauda sp.]
MKENQKNKFKTPEGYFENFNERLMNRMEAEKDQTAGSLIPKTDGFAVPDGYFDGIDQAVKNKLDAGSKVISLRSYRNYYYAAASIAALFVLILAWNWNNNPEMGFDDLANTEIDAYFESNEFGLSSYEIAEVLPVENIGIVDITDSQIEEENIFEYLNDNIEDLDELNLEYDELE